MTGIRGRAADRWRVVKERAPWLVHAIDSYKHYKERNGDHLAAAITYFSFLALFPVALLGVSIAGFVLARNQHLLVRLTNSITRNVSGDFGDKLQQVLDTAIANRAGVGIVGLVGVALAGLGWVDNLRTAIDAVWGIESPKRSFLRTKISDALVLAGLGLGVVLSLALTVAGTAATGTLLSAVGADGVTGVGVLTRVIGILAAVAGDMLIFGWVIIKLPDVTVRRRVAVRTALLAAVGFEVLKVIGTVYIARIAKSPTAGIFGSVVGTLIWIDLVCRFLLLCVSWAATAEQRPPASAQALVQPDEPATVHRGGVIAGTGKGAPAASPLRVAAGLVGAGAALGAGVFAALQRRRAAHRRS